ncbi:hypothetical protein BCR42DRAFT_432023 [Absidia repens]|uniref:Uncharacterized protein n=1 Tax=Absidia repens TaxID=90262 RepID=A0A1X2IXQ8_9FUNG|nr:hypothetical protein BCR42DRAFT_432023 [Absidia repens]
MTTYGISTTCHWCFLDQNVTQDTAHLEYWNILAGYRIGQTDNKVFESMEHLMISRGINLDLMFGLYIYRHQHSNDPRDRCGWTALSQARAMTSQIQGYFIRSSHVVIILHSHFYVNFVSVDTYIDQKHILWEIWFLDLYNFFFTFCFSLSDGFLGLVTKWITGKYHSWQENGATLAVVHEWTKVKLGLDWNFFAAGLCKASFVAGLIEIPIKQSTLSLILEPSYW